ncbi:hypothetical protein M422DRAFT_268148 [Sphaerobolus stellatus SS14]|uniref:Uncharacterized protein n=1 Tax=Sphaerobolus stellatus (strain SS14) TaxID=990650 RepID=A0A0C9TKT3_SPHS4|nr:hypothetical protein M422DRAFT_276203 [Sphaerobolus stellatus SS14]KIJ30388.1 hypothetical protein M422DRAFT_268148 [Sphaerobolus stellatus SS14]
MIIVRKVFSKGKKPARPSDCSNDDIDWISHAMNVAKLTAAASKLIPVAGPFIEGGADVFYMALEPLKQMKMNKEDFKELTQDITTVLEILNRAILIGLPQTEPSVEFTTMCSNFKKLMDRLLEEYKQFDAKSGSRAIRSYLRSGDIKGMISKYQKEVTALLRNLMVFCAVSTNIQVQLLRSNGILSGASQTARRTNDNIPEFEELMEFTQGHIQLQEEIKGHSSYPYYREALPFKEHHALTLINGNVHRTTVREYKGEAAGELTYDQDNILDESMLQALRIQFKGCPTRRSQSETASLLRHFHNIILISFDYLAFDSSVDGYRLGGVYADYNQACQRCQGCLCITNPPNSPWIPHTMQLVANFSLENRDFYSDNWTLYTSAKEKNLKHSTITTRKGMRLSFTQSQWQKSETLVLRHYSYLNDGQRAQLYESFMAQLCHLKERLKNERPCFQCKLTSLRLVSEIHWHINVQLGNHMYTKAGVTWPVDEISLFIDNPEISKNGYIKRPNIYWSRCPQGNTCLTTLERHVFGVEVPRLSCDFWSATFDSRFHNIKPLQEFHELFGLNPFSDDVARAAGALLPRHLNLRNSKQKRRHSFTVHKDIILDRDEVRDGRSYSYRYRRPKNVQILQESSSHLGIRVPVHWQLLAAAEVLPESLRWYDLKTTGHEFEYREVNMDPKYDELPSRCGDFMHEFQSEGKSLEEMLRIFKKRAASGLWYYDYDSE